MVAGRHGCELCDYSFNDYANCLNCGSKICENCLPEQQQKYDVDLTDDCYEWCLSKGTIRCNSLFCDGCYKRRKENIRQILENHKVNLPKKMMDKLIDDLYTIAQ
jgi:hypothetical protein